MSGDGPARVFGEFLNRAGLRTCVAGADLALLSDNRAHVGARLVAGALPRQFVGFHLEEPGHLHHHRINGAGGHALGLAVRRTAGPESLIGLDVSSNSRSGLSLRFLQLVRF